MIWSQAGIKAQVKPTGRWWATIPKAQWPENPRIHGYVAERWREPYGDRRQELVFIGIDVDKAAISVALDDCLLTDEELALGVEGWQNWGDPFPAM